MSGPIRVFAFKESIKASEESVTSASFVVVEDKWA